MSAQPISPSAMSTGRTGVASTASYTLEYLSLKNTLNVEAIDPDAERQQVEHRLEECAREHDEPVAVDRHVALDDRRRPAADEEPGRDAQRRGGHGRPYRSRTRRYARRARRMPPRPQAAR